MKWNILLIIYIFSAANLPTNAKCEVIWESSFDEYQEWQSTKNYTGTVKDTHNLAISQFNTTTFRVSGQQFITDPLLEVKDGIGRNGSKGLIYRMEGANDWRAASLDIDFADPDIRWKTNSISRAGYDELWLRVWYRAPENIDFETMATQFSGGGYRLWKAMRAYSFDPETYCTGCSDPNLYWTTFYSRNESTSSHYLNGGTYYKKPFVIPSWQGTTAYWTPQFIRESDPDGGTSNYLSKSERINTTTHLLSGNDTYNVNGGNPIAGILGDKKWHMIEYHVKMNDIGKANSIQEVYIDGSQNPLSTIGNALELRTSSSRKFRQIIIFDNFLKCDGKTQPLIIDDVIISTNRLPITPKKLKFE